MSGPKVVRIVTREELQAEGLAHLRTVDGALSQCERTAQRHDAWTEERARSLALRRQHVEQLLKREQWAELRRAAAAEISFLNDERARITGAAVQAAELGLRRRERLGAAARSVARSLKAEGHTVPAGLLTMAERASRISDAEFPRLEAELNEAMRNLGESTTSAAGTEEQRSLASRLTAGERGLTFTEWTARHITAEQEQDTRLSRLVAELSVLDPESAAPFMTRARRIAEEPSESQRALLTDSLVIELSALVARERAWSAQVPTLEEARTLLATVPNEHAGALSTRIDAICAARNAGEVPALIAAVRTIVQSEQLRRAGAARRRAILHGLAALGYEVREHMETACAQGGRIVLRRVGVTDYGVELGAPKDAERIQLRLVGSATPADARTASRDRDAEVQWCSEVGELRSRLGAAGSEFVIERALDPGAQPVKTVVFDDVSSAESRAVEAPKLREQKL